MKYTISNKSYNIPNEEIDKLTDTLDISIAEACEMYLSDHDLIECEEAEELTKKANKNHVTGTIHGAKGEKKDRKPREKKENPLKKTIIDIIYTTICDKLVEKDNVVVENPEKYINFIFNNKSFTINLIEHRAKK